MPVADTAARSRFLLLSVTDPSAASRTNLGALLTSLAGQEAEIELVLVLRGGGDAPASPAGNVAIHVLEQPLVIGLSRARNAALAYARSRGLLDSVDVVAFPDDDCRYPPGLLARVAMLISDQCGMVSGSYAPGPDDVDRRRFPREPRALSPEVVMQTVSSNNVFFAARTVMSVGEFDERLGLGARYDASEDSDYVLRALSLGVRGTYVPDDVLVVHPYKAARPQQYYLGNVAVLAKHALRGGGTGWLLVRRLAFGAALMLRRRIAPGEYGQALSAAGHLLLSR